MEVVEVILKDNMYVRHDNDVALNLEREIGVFLISRSYDLSFRAGHNKIYNETSSYKALYNEDAYGFIWQWIADRKGTITNISNNFDEVSKEENINGVLGASRINKILFTIKRITNGKDCESCVC